MFDKSPLFMQNKPNFRNDKHEKYLQEYIRWLRPKNKPNSNPIKAKTNPI